MTTGGPQGGVRATREAAANSALGLAGDTSADVTNEMLAAIVRSSDDAILSKTPTGIVTSWNPAAERLYGWTADEIIGRSIATIIPPERAGEEKTILREVLAGRAIDHYRTTRVHKNGTRIEVSLTVSPIRAADGSIVAASTIARDMTEQVRFETELRGARSEAERARGEAERANAAKNEFLSHMSHELRTPLNVVLGFAQLLELTELDEGQVQSVEQILKAGKHLLELINELLDVSRIETGGMSLSVEPVDARAALAEVVALMAPLASERGISVVEETDGPCWVLADLHRLKQVLLNLLSNAIKYNHDGGSVRLRTGRAPGGAVRIAVSDTGPGMSGEQLERLFTPFDRLGAEKTAVEGTGLGLPLSRGLIEAMQGRIAVESQPGVGSTFLVELRPAEPAEVDGGHAEHTVGDGAAAYAGTVLYIEDNLANVQLVERLVGRRSELRLLPAMQGSRGLELAREHTPALILLDLDLPDISGEDVLARLRADPATADVPVVVLSADATAARRERLLAAGAREYMAKPIDVKRFLAVLDEQVSGRLDR